MSEHPGARRRALIAAQRDLHELLHAGPAARGRESPYDRDARVGGAFARLPDDVLRAAAGDALKRIGHELDRLLKASGKAGTL